MNDSMARVARRLVAVLLVGLSLAVSKATSAQSLAEVAALNSQVEELYRQGRYSRRHHWRSAFCAFREAALGLNHPDVGTSINNLAILYQDQGLYRDAEPLFKAGLGNK
jgi:hypothetical protein